MYVCSIAWLELASMNLSDCQFQRKLHHQRFLSRYFRDNITNQSTQLSCCYVDKFFFFRSLPSSTTSQQTWTPYCRLPLHSRQTEKHANILIYTERPKSSLIPPASVASPPPSSTLFMTSPKSQSWLPLSCTALSPAAFSTRGASSSSPSGSPPGGKRGLSIYTSIYVSYC